MEKVITSGPGLDLYCFLSNFPFFIIMKLVFTILKFLSVTFQTHYFWPNANKIEMIFCLYMYILMGKRLAVFLNSFLLLQNFVWVKNVKIDFFKKKWF